MIKTGNKEKTSKLFTLSRGQQIMLGVFLILFSIIIFASLTSYFNTWRADQSEIESFFDKDSESLNVAKKFGSLISHFLVYKMFGVASFIISILLRSSDSRSCSSFASQRYSLLPWVW